jgi:hypothetical protein
MGNEASAEAPRRLRPLNVVFDTKRKIV